MVTMENGKPLTGVEVDESGWGESKLPSLIINNSDCTELNHKLMIPVA